MADEKKPRRRRKKDEEAEPREEAVEAKAEEQAEEEEPEEAPVAEAEETPEAEAAEPEGDEGEAEEEEEEAEPKPRRRRGAAETSAPKKKDEPARPAPRDKTGAIAVRAQAKYVRRAPRKARLVMDHIRGKDVSEARAILRHTPRAAAEDIAKLLESAVANAENNFELDPEGLRIGRAVVDEGPTLKRYRPRALGRATAIHKRTSHMTITLTTGDEDN